MPFTPFHFGLGYSVAAIERKPARFCFLAFVVTQVVIDVETLVNMIRGANRLHTYFHSFLGSLVAAAIAYFLTYGIIWVGEKVFGVLPSAIGGAFRSLRMFPEVWPTKACVTLSVLVGAWSHVVLDSIMHSDMWPLWPFSTWNPFLDLMDVGALHLLCMALFVAGLIFVFVSKRIRGGPQKIKKGHRDHLVFFFAFVLALFWFTYLVSSHFRVLNQKVDEVFPPGSADLMEELP
jgi:hypothetical protein